MSSGARRDRLTLMVIGLFLLSAPLLVLVATLEVLILLGEIDFADLTLVELLELYVIDVVVLAVFAFVVYRLTHHLVIRELPKVVDEDDEDTDDE